MAYTENQAFELIESAHARGRLGHAFIISGAKTAGLQELTTRVINLINATVAEPVEDAGMDLCGEPVVTQPVQQAENLDELKGEIGRLSFKVREALRKGYEEGREKGYRAVINELRSLRIQKSIILDVFDRNKELKSLFKKLTGKTIRQYLEFEKRKRLKGGAGN